MKNWILAFTNKRITPIGAVDDDAIKQLLTDVEPIVVLPPIAAIPYNNVFEPVEFLGKQFEEEKNLTDAIENMIT